MKILNYGSLNIDYTYSVDHFVRGGETMSSEEMHVFSGGKGLNQSIALSKSGAEVWHAGAIGTGDGDFLIRQLKEAGVNTEYISVLDGKTGHAIIQKAKDGGNCILLFGGATSRLPGKCGWVMDHFEKGDTWYCRMKSARLAISWREPAKKAWCLYSTLLPWTIKSVPIPWNMWIISC